MARWNGKVFQREQRNLDLGPCFGAKYSAVGRSALGTFTRIRVLQVYFPPNDTHKHIRERHERWLLALRYESISDANTYTLVPIYISVTQRMCLITYSRLRWNL